ncbi:MAG: hypothetical protein K0U68_02595 [Gammaproteobacteria bacterium]|nr:hypothetical protein [Gammaproteobacteria bacterium]
MENIYKLNLLLGLILCFSLTTVFAIPVTNPALSITHQVTIQPIVVSDDDNSNAATFFGNSRQQSLIEKYIDVIWSQAGINVDFLSARNWKNSFANSGNPENNNPRPNWDLRTIISEGTAAGVTHRNASVVNMFFVNVIPSASALTNNFTAGMAFIGRNGISQYVGSGLLSSSAGLELIATVVSHELGHNLGLRHSNRLDFPEKNQNLMWSSSLGPGRRSGQRLNQAQINIAQDSNLSVKIASAPIPGAVWLFGSALVVLIGFKQRHQKSA